MKLACKCGTSLDVPDVEAGAERILFCQKCGSRTRIERRADGRIGATRLARPEVDVECACGARFKAHPPDAGGEVACPVCGRSFSIRKEVRARAGGAAAAGPPAPAGLEAIVCVSAAAGRNQDRGLWHAAAGIGCVCDGVTSSARSDEAAEIVTREAPAMFKGGDLAAGVRAMGGRLLAARAALLARPLDQAELAAAGGDPRAAAAERTRSHQTTLLAFRVAAGAAPETWDVDVARCGDAGFVAIGSAGLAAAVGVRGHKEGAKEAASGGGTPAAATLPHVRFADRAPGTFCLPDGVHAAEICRVAVPRSAWLVAATDGFFDGFEGSRTLGAWLESNAGTLRDPGRRAALVAAIHRKLEAGEKGDDDIAFVIVMPEVAR